MSRKLIFILFIFLQQLVIAQVSVPHFNDSLFSTYYHQRVTLFRSLPSTRDEIIFLGNSITDGNEWSELFQDLRLKNRGISGDNTVGVLHRLEEIYQRKPAKVFLLIGINDLAQKTKPDSVVKNILWIASLIKEKSPTTKLFIQSILPVSENFGKFVNHTNKKDQILSINKTLSELAPAKSYTFIDIFSAFCDSTGRMNASYTNDGLHLTGAGYQKWKELLYNKIYDVPSLIPAPQKLDWLNEKFSLTDCKSIVISHPSLKKEALLPQRHLLSKGFSTQIKNKASSHESCIELRLEEFETPYLKEEAYTLNISIKSILIKAHTTHGAFNAIQTLYQLITKNLVQGCQIVDSPAFAWRGYMVDVGRNYQSLQQLMQQIDVMARYKLNIFQFHLTENIAWRLQVKKYPQLTASKNMIRQKGKFYNIEEVKKLINYCKERHITLVPEIDMPGHSEAFTRAMGIDMQSEKGLLIVKEIIKEFCETFDIPYLHIGGDEVKITNNNFLPEVIQYAESLGKKTIGWDPGGNIGNNTIRQLWEGNRKVTNQFQYIDSKHLYLNHMDPLEAVVTIFNRKIGDRVQSDANLLGGILCLWHDRNITHEKDLLTMNPVYPGILAFAERSWRGGGSENWITNINNQTQLSEFISFEERLMAHKKQYFQNMPFPYEAQSSIKWKLWGPFENEGDVSKSFHPEKENFNTSNETPLLEAYGGTVILRHWWSPMVKGVLPEPKENTTWYATRNFWSKSDTTLSLWAGFNNISRSTATDLPLTGTWDNKQSKLWINNEIINPPDWQNTTKKSSIEMPLSDEGYQYRPPLKIKVHKGWNEIKVKTPVGSFKGTNWQNPVKWMFTVILTEL